MSSHLGVSYDDLSDASIGYIKDRISQYGYLRSYIHNHPSNMAVPSGLGTDNSQGGYVVPKQYEICIYDTWSY